MSRFMILAIAASIGASGKLLSAVGSPAAPLAADPPVNLQSATPGVAQVGHANITGTIRAGSLVGQSPGPTDKAIYGLASSSTGFNFGGYFQSSSILGKGVFGIGSSSAGTNYGGFFRSLSTSGVGVAGEATTPTGATYGGYFKSSSSSGYGVFGTATATSGNSFGGYFRSASPTGIAVYGRAASTTGVNYGVYGQSSSLTGYAGFFEGNARTTGTLSANLFVGNGGGLTNIPWDSIAGKPTSYPPGGPATGDLTGSYPNPSIALVAVTTGKIADLAVTNAKIADGAVTDSKVTSVDWSKLLNIPDAGGDVTGTFSSLTVAKLLGRSLSLTPPTDGQVLKWSGGAWTPMTDETGGGGGTVTSITQGTGMTLTPNPITSSGSVAFDSAWGDTRYINEGQVAGGDLSGTFPNPDVIKLQGRLVASDSPADRQVLTWESSTSSWKPKDNRLVLPVSESYNTGAIPIFQLTNVASGDGIAAITNGGKALFGVANAGSGTSYGVYGQSRSSTGIGVQGYASATSGSSVGGWFQNDSDSGKGLIAQATATSGVTYGVYGQSNSTSGIGVQGYTSATNGNTYGGWFQNSSSAGRGVFGISTPSSGTTYGVYGQTNSTTGGAGVLGKGPWGVDAIGVGSFATGLRAFVDGTSSYGVFAYASAQSGANYGVYGRADSASGWGLFADGRIGASIKAWRLDHPFDPANKYLVHYSTEGPEAINSYSGTVKTDPSGYAWVDLPDYFEEINRDFRYQLTVVDGSDDFVLAKVTKEVVRNRFQIRSSKPGVKVCWEVKGVRNDRWIRAYGAPVEVEKQGAERGKYQHPELYGQPPEMGIAYRESTPSTGGKTRGNPGPAPRR